MGSPPISIISIYYYRVKFTNSALPMAIKLVAKTESTSEETLAMNANAKTICATKERKS